MPFGGLVVNRVHALDGVVAGDGDGSTAGAVDAAALEAALGPRLAAKVARAYAEERALAERDAAAVGAAARRDG